MLGRRGSTDLHVILEGSKIYELVVSLFTNTRPRETKECLATLFQRKPKGASKMLQNCTYAYMFYSMSNKSKVLKTGLDGFLRTMEETLRERWSFL